MKQAVLSEQHQFPSALLYSQMFSQSPELSYPLVITTGQPPPPQQNVGYTLAKFRVYQISSRKSIAYQCTIVVLKKAKKQKAIRQDLFWTAGVILQGESGNMMQCGLRVLPSKESLALPQGGTPGCKEPGAHRKLVGTTPSCHLFYCPKWLCASPPPRFWKKNAEKLALTEALGFYTSSTQL